MMTIILRDAEHYRLAVCGNVSSERAATFIATALVQAADNAHERETRRAGIEPNAPRTFVVEVYPGTVRPDMAAILCPPD